MIPPFISDMMMAPSELPAPVVAVGAVSLGPCAQVMAANGLPDTVAALLGPILIFVFSWGWKVWTARQLAQAVAVAPKKES